MRRTVAIVLIVLGALLLAGSAMALTLNEQKTTTTPEDDIRRVVVENENGDVTMSVGKSTSVQRTERWNFVRPDYSERIEDGTLTIRTDCAEMLMFNNCGVELSLVVPDDVDVATESTNGDVDIQGFQNDTISVATTNGDVRLHNAAVDSVAVTSTNGDLTFEDVTIDVLRARTTNGDVGTALNGRPESVTLTSTNGDIDAELPSGPYDIRTATTNGDVGIDDDLEDDDEADGRISVATTNGDIEIRSHDRSPMAPARG